MTMFKPIKGYEGRYLINEEGVIMGLTKTRFPAVLKPRMSIGGYMRVSLKNESSYKHPYVHVLLAQHFLPDPKPGQTQVNHKDGNKANVSLSNLEWCTPKENVRHAWDTGLYDRTNHGIGSRRGQPRAALNESAVRDIRQSNLKMAELARKYGVSRGAIEAVVHLRSWKKVV